MIKNKIFLKIILLIVFLQANLGFSQQVDVEQEIYSINDEGLYDISEFGITLPYDPAWAKKSNGGPLMIAQLKVTTVSSEVDPKQVFFNGGMYLKIFAPTLSSDSVKASQHPLPVVVFGNGGGFLNPIDSKGYEYPQYLAKRGFIVVVPTYRIGICLYNELLAERAIFRAVQDMRVAIKYARQLDTDSYFVDETLPLSYVGWSSGAFVGIHNLYLTDDIEDTRAIRGENFINVEKKYPFGIIKDKGDVLPYDLGPIDLPALLTTASEAYLETLSEYDPIQDITVAVSGALGQLSWIAERGEENKPKILYTIHHPLDMVVPYYEGVAFKGYGLFDNPYWFFPTINGSGRLDQYYERNPTFRPDDYRHRFVDENSLGDEHITAEDYDYGSIKGDAGGVLGPLNYPTWFHDPFSNSRASNIGYDDNDIVRKAIYDYLAEKVNDVISDNAAKSLSPTVGNDQSNFIIFPNPSSANISILLPTSIDNGTKVEIKMFNLLGQLVASKSNIKTNEEINWNLKEKGNVYSGEYIITIKSNLYYESFDHIIK